MTNRLRSFLPIVFIGAAVLSAIAWFWWSSVRRAEIAFLPEMAPANWILYASPLLGDTHALVPLSTTFRSRLDLDKAPSRATARIAGFRRYRLAINGTTLEQPERRGGNWKQPDLFDIARGLHVGVNQIEITVFNSNGPPALWCALHVDGHPLVTDEKWGASCSGAVWQNARLSTRPRPAPAGSLAYRQEQPWQCLKARWRELLLFSVIVLAGYVGYRWRVRRGGWENRRLQLLPVAGGILLWTALFANNLTAFPEAMGFDYFGHLDYIQYILQHRSLPLADDGWEMFQPPLYYLLCAAALKLFSLSVSKPGGILLLRLLGWMIGVIHWLFVWGSLRLVFPQDPRKVAWGLALTAFLAPLLYVPEYITNEALAATLVTASVYLCLRVLRQGQVSWKLCVALGLCLGGALLTKLTALLMLPLVAGVWVWKWQPRREPGLLRWSSELAMVLAVAALICGWYYGQVWLHFGKPFVGNWDQETGFSWWQDDGYRTGAYYLRAGQALVRPWFSSGASFADGIYSTLWADGQLAGSTNPFFRPPWNYDLMALGCWLALLPTGAVALGAALALRRFVRQPTGEWFFLLGLGFLVVMALVAMSLKVPSYAQVKAFYGLSALVPLCATAALGLDRLTRHPHWRLLVCLLFGLWALNSYASFWIRITAGETSLSRAWLLRFGDRYQEAINILGNLLSREPGNGPACALLADTLSHTGEWTAAATQAELALRSGPEDPIAHVVLAAALARQGQTGPAMEHARKVVALRPGLGAGYEQLAALLVHGQDMEEAIRIARAGLALDPFNAKLRLALGRALDARGQGPEAVSQAELAVELDAQSLSGRTLLADLLSQAGRLDDALAQYREVARIDTNNAAAFAKMATVLLQQGKLSQATNCLSEALRLQPDNGQARQLFEQIARAKAPPLGQEH
jgi:tetratricopeptide (TPR) repeat protein